MLKECKLQNVNKLSVHMIERWYKWVGNIWEKIVASVVLMLFTVMKNATSPMHLSKSILLNHKNIQFIILEDQKNI